MTGTNYGSSNPATVNDKRQGSWKASWSLILTKERIVRGNASLRLHSMKLVNSVSQVRVVYLGTSCVCTSCIQVESVRPLPALWFNDMDITLVC
jgi:hypothetical protein